VLQLREPPEPVPRRDDVRVKGLATAVTSNEYLIRSLELPVDPDGSTGIRLPWQGAACTR
jgi:NADPH:quinone reductase-like Zn-dependent oxidoreductase